MSTKPTEEDLKRDLAADLAWLLGSDPQWGSDLEKCIDGYSPMAHAAACRRALFAEAILGAPLVALFGDGRQPSENERHLLNLLSWREHENAQLKAELQHLRDARQ